MLRAEGGSWEEVCSMRGGEGRGLDRVGGEGEWREAGSEWVMTVGEDAGTELVVRREGERLGQGGW